MTYYHTYFADSDGIAQWDQYTWTMDAPATADEMLHIDAWAISDNGYGHFNLLMVSGVRLVGSMLNTKGLLERAEICAKCD